MNGHTAFCDVRVSNPLARCHLHHSVSAIDKNNKSKKKQVHNQRILQVKRGSFTPLVFSCFGRMIRKCSHLFSHTAERLVNRRTETKSNISAWIKGRLDFALIESMLLCLWGTRVPSNVDNISETYLYGLIAEGNVE